MKIISLASTIWTERWMNRQQLMSRLGRNHTVLYSNASWYTWDRHTPEWKLAPLWGAFDLRDNVWVESSPRWMMRTPRLPILDQAVTQMHAARWRHWLADRGEGPLILHLFHPAYIEYIPFVRADALVYQPYDWFEFMPGWTPQLEAAERRLLKLADAVITPSESFAKGLEEKSQRPVRVVLNGVDIDLFAEAVSAKKPPPPDLASIPNPRIGYVGWLETHVDLALIATLATRRPEWHFVFVGGQTPHVDDRLTRELEVCKSKPNIHFLGPKQRADVPAYMLNMDVNTICWRLEEGSWAGVGYPLKLQEYLACGKGIVSADLHSVRTTLSHVIRTARDPDEWESAIADVLRTGGPGSPAERSSIARQNSWDRRSAQLEAILSEAAQGPFKKSSRDTGVHA
jgi:glycosyltransferase involved in cell wall biosynthesis